MQVRKLSGIRDYFVIALQVKTFDHSATEFILTLALV